MRNATSTFPLWCRPYLVCYVRVQDAVTSDASYNDSTSDWTATASQFDVDDARETAAFGPAFFNANGNQYQQCDSTGKVFPNQG